MSTTPGMHPIDPALAFHMKDCSDDGWDRAEEITPREGSAYYIVVAQRGADEGSHGTASSGAERPAPAPAQRRRPTQNLLACAP